MDKHEFEQFVTEHGKDILRFCRMNAGSTERGNELYQDTMVKLLEKQKEGKKRMRQFGTVEVPQEAFTAVLKYDDNK